MKCLSLSLVHTFSHCTIMQFLGHRGYKVRNIKVCSTQRHFPDDLNLQLRPVSLYREIIAVCCETHTKHINTLRGQNVENLAAFAKLRKVTISFVMSVRPPVCPHKKNSASTVRIFMTFIFDDFSKTNRENSSLKSHKNNGYFTWRPIYIFDHILLSSS